MGDRRCCHFRKAILCNGLYNFLLSCRMHSDLLPKKFYYNIYLFTCRTLLTKWIFLDFQSMILIHGLRFKINVSFWKNLKSYSKFVKNVQSSYISLPSSLGVNILYNITLVQYFKLNYRIYLDFPIFSYQNLFFFCSRIQNCYTCLFLKTCIDKKTKQSAGNPLTLRQLWRFLVQILLHFFSMENINPFSKNYSDFHKRQV